MYGFIYSTLRTLVVNKFGADAWREICEEAECLPIVDGILDRHYYDESYLNRVGLMAQDKLGIPLEKIMELFGAFFFETCKKSGHSRMLRTLGHNLYSFLANLDPLHDHLSYTYSKMQAPSFCCLKTNAGLTLHYYSHRYGLSNIVLGIVKAVAIDYYSLDITMEMVKYEKLKQKLCHHYTFEIVVKESSRYEGYLERLSGDRLLSKAVSPLPPKTNLPSPTAAQCPFIRMEPSTPDHQLDSLKESTPDQLKSLKESLMRAGIADNNGDLPSPVLPGISFSRLASRRASTFPVELNTWPITQALFEKCFPFHITFDKSLRIISMGSSLTRMFPEAVLDRDMLTKHFALHRPMMELTYDNIVGSMYSIFVLRIKSYSISGEEVNDSNVIHFKGQMVPISRASDTSLLYLASPRVTSIEELEQQGLYLSDIPIHDVTRDLILLNRHFRVELGISKELEETKKDLQKQKIIAEEERLRADDLLHAMLPKSVAHELKKHREVSAMVFPEVTILFSDIKGFTNICNRCTPIQVVKMLNQLYTHFDGQLEKHNVYKVETIGDAYMVAAGLLDTSTDHAVAITNMAFALREEAGNVMDPVDNEPIKIRIGVHSGGVVAGVVGRKMPRYCLFGDTVNTASRMESHGEAGHIHMSGTTYNMLKDKGEQFVFYSRGLIEIKGLGRKQTYFVERPGADGAVCEIIYVKPDSGNEDTNGLSSNVHRQSIESGMGIMGSNSFIKLSQCTIVPPHNSLPSCPFGEPPSTNGLSPRLEMVRPPTQVIHVSPRISPEGKPYEANGQNGVSSLFISDPPSTSVSKEQPLTDSAAARTHSKERNKCVIS